MPNTHETLTSLFTDIADAIREKTGGTAPIVADDFPDEISAIPSGGAAFRTYDSGTILEYAYLDYTVSGGTAMFTTVKEV